MQDSALTTDSSWFRQLFESSPDPTWIIEGGYFVECNLAAIHFLGYSCREDLLNIRPSQLSPPNQPDGEDSLDKAERMMALAHEKGLHRFEWMHCRRDGSEFLAEVTLSALHLEKRTIIYCVWRDISERKATEERISHMAHHDALTGLLNRSSLTARMEQALATARREQRQLAVLFLDLDRFKTTNDTLGHAAGDTLLIEVARRLTASVRNSDIVARLGGDEFVVILTDIENAPAAARIAEKIQMALSKICHIGEFQVRTTPSIGLSFFPTDGMDTETLMKHADAAMYHAKSQGRNNIQFFSAEFNQYVVRRIHMEHAMREALAANCFELHYQPQVDAQSHAIVSVEALLRWRTPQEGLLMPAEFIPIAEESGLILPLGEWVMDEACRQLRAWRDQGIANVRMAINLSALQLCSTHLLPCIEATLRKHQISGEELELEITESMMMNDPIACIARLEALRSMGIHLAIDDFGTGYSSLSQIRQMPIDRLKIDYSFVRDIEFDESAWAICTATIALAHKLGLSVVAEGVETPTQQRLLTSHDCDFLQGYLFSRPVDAASTLQLLKTGPVWSC